MKLNNQLEATIFVIFGGAGDLTWRKLIPSLFDLYISQNMPKNFNITVLDRVDFSDKDLQKHFHLGVNQFSRYGKAKLSEWNKFAAHIHYQKGDFKDLQTYVDLEKFCTAIEKGWGLKAHRIFYMATPPSMFGEIPKYLGKSGLAKDIQYARLVIEKPIGYDLESARALNATLAANFQESQIFRIDHYLGKETVQNILAFRFANPIFEPIWNRAYVDYITITVAEVVGVENRGAYYDHAGALRDMIQNHLMQLLCLVAMEPMLSFAADEIRNKKVDVLHAIRPIKKKEVGRCAIRGQYGKGVSQEKKVPGYREEEGVSPNSKTETFVALRLLIDNWRWQDVPFYLRTGKRLKHQASEISIQFREVPHLAFPPQSSEDCLPTRLVISIQPDEGIVLSFKAKYPGPSMELRTVEMQFNYEDSFAIKSPDAYETLLWDIMKNDPTLFMRSDQVEAAWQLLMPVIEEWKQSSPKEFPNYAAGSWGPDSAQSILFEGHCWPLPTELMNYSIKKRKKFKSKPK